MYKARRPSGYNSSLAPKRPISFEGFLASHVFLLSTVAGARAACTKIAIQSISILRLEGLLYSIGSKLQALNEA